MNLPPHQNPTQEGRTASAPYNFVPLPEKVVNAVKDPENELPDQDRFHTNRKTGYFEVELTAKAPLYVRCALTLPEFLRSESEEEKKRPFRERAKNTPDFFYTHDSNQPVIPGSSLRGMLRNLLEAASYGKMENVQASPRIFFRAVAAPDKDPLKEPYQKILGRFGANIHAGYLEHRPDGWYIKPAQKLSQLKWSQNGEVNQRLRGKTFFTIKEDLLIETLPDLIRLEAKNYRPQYYDLQFDLRQEKGKFAPEAKAFNITPGHGNTGNNGVLVCTGNMRETGPEVKEDKSMGREKEFRRKHHTIVPAKDSKATLKKINEQALEDYLSALTDFQKQEPPFTEQMGFLQHDRPVFYVEVDELGDEIFYFGHCPNFRIPAMIEEEKRAATPNDFVPAHCKEAKTIDFAEAIFGHIKGPVSGAKPGDKAYAYAGRVFVTDAKCDEQQPWLQANPFVPRILASPKPTAFQHYLVQKFPNDTRQLYHYGSTPITETVIRGRKFYWHHGKKEGVGDEALLTFISESEETLKDIAMKEAVEKYDTQHTQFKPVKPGTHFRFRVYFENLSEVELGALCWVLQPLAHPEFNQQKELCHHLGMGKPLGMGSVKLSATLFFTERKARYEKLFDGNDWQTGVRKTDGKLVPESLENYRTEFERRVLKTLQLDSKYEHLYDLERIAMLLKLMEWPGFPAVLEPKQDNRFLDDLKRPNTRYMTITLPNVEKKDANEYKERPVLPDSAAFGGLLGAQAVPAVDEKDQPDSDGSPSPKSPQPKPVPQKSTTIKTSKPPSQQPLEISPETRAMLKSVEKQRQLTEVVSQSVYSNGEVEKKALVTKNPDGSLSVALPRLKDKAFPLKPKPQFSQANAGAKIRGRVVVDKNNAIIRVEEL